VVFNFAAVGDTSRAQLVVRNPTTVPMVLDSLALIFTNPPFALLDSIVLRDSTGAYDTLLAETGGILLPDTLQPGDSLLLRFAYFPQSEGSASGQMFFHTNAPCPDSLLVELQASSSRKPAIAYSAGNFTNLLCSDEQSSSTTVTLRNIGGLPLTVSQLVKTGANVADFEITGPATPIIIQPGGSEDVTLDFVPKAVGSVRAFTLQIVSDAENEPLVQLSFTARKDSVGMSVSPAAEDLGERYICEFPQTIEYTYTNHGTVDLDLSIATALPTGFSITPRTWPVRIAPGANFVLRLTLDPPAGAYGDYQVQIPSSVPLCGVNHVVAASYRYAPHVAAIAPPAIDFGTLGFGGSSTGSVTVTNPQGTPMRVRITTPAGPEITITSPSTRDTVLAPGATLTIAMRFDANSSGDITDLLRIVTTQVAATLSSYR
jgi:hypothetical protein